MKIYTMPSGATRISLDKEEAEKIAFLLLNHINQADIAYEHFSFIRSFERELDYSRERSALKMKKEILRGK